jgi:FkbM family methyltransferase
MSNNIKNHIVGDDFAGRISVEYNTWQVERIYDIILHHYGRQGNSIFNLSVGSCDGCFHDTISGYMTKYSWVGMFCEPIPDAFNRLSEYVTKELPPGCILENVAVSDTERVETMCYIPWDILERENLHEAIRGMASFIPPKNGFDSDVDTKKLLDTYGDLIDVPVTTVDKLLEKHNISAVDFCTIDTEGYDYQVFQAFNIEKYKPKVIKFELFNEDHDKLIDVFDRLVAAGYILTNQEGCDIMAFRKDEIEKFKSNKRWVEVQKLGQCVENIGYRLDIDRNYVDVPECIEDGDHFIDDSKSNVITAVPTNEQSKTTIVTGIWDLKRDTLSDSFKRSFSHYLDKFEELLKTDTPMIIYIESKYEDFVWKHRDRKNTHVIIKEISEFKTWFEFYDKVQSIRSDPAWYTKASWLAESTQAGLELYNPMVMSKMFMLNDARISNPFDTDYFLWVDGGITNTVHPGYFTHDKVINKIHNYLHKFLFVCFPYENYEIHGFDHDRLREYCNVDKTTRVARAGVFGGHKDYIGKVNTFYYDYLKSTLEEDQMGTEECIFTILSYKHEGIIDRVMINDDGLFSTFFEALKDNTVDLITANNARAVNELNNYLYVVTYNSPAQFRKLCENWSSVDRWFADCNKVVLNNSIDRNTDKEYAEIFNLYGFTEHKKDNIGICGGRQWVAEHFESTNGDYYIFLEDDMYIHDKWQGCCRSGFTTFVDGLYTKCYNIMERHKYDFLKLCFSEFFGDNRTQWSWYNVPQEVRETLWPEKKYLPVSGLDPNAPLVKYNNIHNEDGLAYVDGEIYYCNWPQIVSKAGNKKMFLTDKWAHPFEQTWMSYIHQQIIKNDIKSAILLATPIYHDRFDHYNGDERREN